MEHIAIFNNIITDIPCWIFPYYIQKLHYEKLQKFYVSLSWLYLTTTLSSLPTLILELMLHLSIRDFYIIKIDQVYDITWWGGFIGQLLFIFTWKCFCLLWSFLGYNYQWLELMNQKSCVRNIYERREEIFVFLCQLQNINDEKNIGIYVHIVASWLQLIYLLSVSLFVIL